MWIYSTTAATSAASTAVSRSAQTSISNSVSVSLTAGGGAIVSSLVNANSVASTFAAAPHETFGTEQGATSSNFTRQQTAASPPYASIGETFGGTTAYARTLSSGFSRSVTSYAESITQTQSQNDAGATASYSLTTLSTSSSVSTSLATRDSYLSGTQTTTSASTAGATTSTSTTSSSVVGASAGGTTSASVTASVMTSAAVATVATVTIYATAAARTLTAAENLVPVTEAEANEDLWEVTATADTAGFISEIGTQITSRVGTVATASSALAVAATSSFVVTASSLATSAAATVDSTQISALPDTHVPFASVIPATATSTRSFDAITVIPATVAQSQLASYVASVSGLASDSATTAATIRRTTTAGLPIAWNQSPTVTSTALLGVTVATSSTIPDRPTPPEYATSYSTTNTEVTSGAATSMSATTTSTASVSTTSTASSYVGTYATTFTVFISSASATDLCALSPSTQTDSSQTNFAGYTNVEHFSTLHNAPTHTLSTYAEQWLAYTVASTTTQSTTATTSASTTSTAVVGGNYTQLFAYTSSEVDGVSVTYAQLFPQVTFDGSAQWTALAWRQGGGFQHPLSLGTGAALMTSQPAAASFRWIDEASQMNVSGAASPELFTAETYFTTGATLATARFDTSDSHFHLTTRTTATTTSTLGTSTVVRTTSGNTSAVSASLGAVTPATYYSATRITDGSAIGGQAGNTAFAFTAIVGPGVRHSTAQSAGASVSGTSWGTDWLVVSGTSLGVALPTRAESAYSVTQRRTAWHLAMKRSFDALTGSTSRPLVALSKYPNL